MEQDQYVVEEIPWQFVDYPNNDVCVAMLETRQMGMFSLLDEQCLIPKGNDEKLANKLYETLEKHESFTVSKLQKAKRQFVIHHYAGDVCYSTDGFCDKNKDHMHPEAGTLMMTSLSKFVRSIFEHDEITKKRGEERGDARRRSGFMSSTVVSQFKSQLTSLLETINATDPHFVRCIKPNDEVSSTLFDRARLVEQLRCSGVLEAVKISRSGYPVRFSHDDFIKNYGCILGERYDSAQNSKSVVSQMVHTLGTKLAIDKNTEAGSPPPFQIGKTKVFCVQSAYHQLETARAKAVHSSRYHSPALLQRLCKTAIFLANAIKRSAHSGIVASSTLSAEVSCRCTKEPLRYQTAVYNSRLPRASMATTNEGSYSTPVICAGMACSTRAFCKHIEFRARRLIRW
ncbi:hypothetical protein PINS_up022683 [Pythium insidiosum]|nr:hypothetical protein PINS_up022683 [Pythium insidiosum]